VQVARDGTVTKTVTITYKNPEAHDGWLNSILPNWVRVYVPEGSELVDVSGLEEKEDPYTDQDGLESGQYNPRFTIFMV